MQQSVVAAPPPGAEVGCGEQSLDLVPGQVAHVAPVDPFGGNGQHLLDQGGVLRRVEGGVTEQRVDRRQSRIAGGGAVAPAAFQVFEEGADQGGVEIAEVEVGGLFAGVLARVAKQQPDGVAVGDDGVRAGLALVGERSVKKPRIRGASDVMGALRGRRRAGLRPG